MKRLLVSTMILLLAAVSAHATQETLTSAGPLDCSAISYCVQNTSDGLFELDFVPTYPTSGPGPNGYNVNEQAIRSTTPAAAPSISTSCRSP